MNREENQGKGEEEIHVLGFQIPDNHVVALFPWLKEMKTQELSCVCVRFPMSVALFCETVMFASLGKCCKGVFILPSAENH